MFSALAIAVRPKAEIVRLYMPALNSTVVLCIVFVHGRQQRASANYEEFSSELAFLGKLPSSLLRVALRLKCCLLMLPQIGKRELSNTVSRTNKKLESRKCLQPW